VRSPKVIRWGFDPTKSTIPVLKTGRRVWAFIRVNHIVDQHFDDHVEILVEAIKKTSPKDPKALRCLAERSGLGCFGIEMVGERTWDSHRVPDMEWWTDLFDLVNGNPLVEQQFPPESEKQP
jgi:hypothetical protein